MNLHSVSPGGRSHGQCSGGARKGTKQGRDLTGPPGTVPVGTWWWREWETFAPLSSASQCERCSVLLVDSAALPAQSFAFLLSSLAQQPLSRLGHHSLLAWDMPLGVSLLLGDPMSCWQTP